MRDEIEGSTALARAIGRCRPHVICATPIAPPSLVAEGLGDLARLGGLENCEFIAVESESAALSAALGASAAGARVYAAIASQRALCMAEAAQHAASLGLPIVMTLGDRALGAPIGVAGDHSDAMALREAGWIQLFAESEQEAVDLHIQAFRLAEALCAPVMVCVDGSLLAGAAERIDIPGQADVDAYLPPYEPIEALDPEDSNAIGAMGGPDACTEVRYLQYLRATA